MLIGQYRQKLTQKDRIALPKKFREELGTEGVIAKWYEGCLVVVSTERWLELLNKLTGGSNIITAPVRDTDRFIMGSAFEITFDSQGRFVVPKILKEYAKLENDVVCIGLGSRIEIWDHKIWEEQEKLIQERASDMVEKLASDSK